ncbi:MAG: inositol 2-dehydrogenase [Treponema sp. GWB1_62_6]|nr:MAG: inositol 2-dehydrogenase [Treponema sp. GWA1_62_8]OHE66665.1 MAG: inositol 2-dehydrogenase [Treponema sp. GWC1_61_84]OHE70992.1 MAG: inositol 2-dehydrogenase [Treponema sp. GWB1_62_6]OHE74488.1 MAG: inositol 2-dehydrogenase [Treponema sp. RIFOXYC1_FULL_61_9]HCM25669.1 inositol 2-dehydrogenase [Treponema sp.]
MRKIKIGSVGLGRLGLRHAENIATRIQNAELTALCDVDRKKLDAVADRLGVPNRYSSFEEMLAQDDLDAVVLVSPSALHTGQIAAALAAGKHVFSEKPLGVTVEDCKKAEKAVEAHPDKVFMLGFMRRFDESYQYAHRKIKAGEIGEPVLFRSYSQDPEKFIDGAIAFAAHSGGQFLDMAVHDIDLARWMTGSEPETVYAIGGCYAHPEFSKYDDGDNVSCLMKFRNKCMVFLFAGRTAPHGYNVETEIIGTKGILRIASVPQKNHVEILDVHGVRRECSENFLERFETSYLNEVQEFVSCIVEKRKPEVTVYDGTRVSEIAYACKSSFEKGELLKF